jgi:3'(2'), 5'-bisphosphate nucleotidase
MLYEQEKEIAIASVQLAAKLCEKVRYDQAEQTITKADSSPVTFADFGAQALVCQSLWEAFPDDPVLGEEDAEMLSPQQLDQITHYVQQQRPQATPDQVRGWINHGKGETASRYWTLDPIDGTKGFIRGAQYAIALALVEAGEVKVGVLACPALPLDADNPKGEKGAIFVAVKNQGTLLMALDGEFCQPLQVNSHTDPSLVQVIRSVETVHSDRAQQQDLIHTLNYSRRPISMDSQAKYGSVARGEADLYVRIPLPQYQLKRENIWDHAAGAIVVTEAGGKVTDLSGKPLDFAQGTKLNNNVGIVASNGIIHAQVLEACQQLAVVKSSE